MDQQTAAELTLRIKVRDTDLYDRPFLRGGCSRRRVGLWRLFRPRSVNPVAKCRNARVVTKENTVGVEQIIGPGIVRKRLSVIGGAGEDNDLLLVVRVAAAVIEDDVYRTGCRIDR